MHCGERRTKRRRRFDRGLGIHSPSLVKISRNNQDDRVVFGNESEGSETATGDHDGAEGLEVMDVMPHHAHLLRLSPVGFRPFIFSGQRIETCHVPRQQAAAGENGYNMAIAHLPCWSVCLSLHLGLSPMQAVSGERRGLARLH